MRQCLGCNEHKPKIELLRVVRSPEGEISLDFKGKKSGRGAYICYDIKFLEKAQKSKRLEKALEIIKSILRYNEEIETNDSLVYIEKLNSSSIDIHMQAYVNYGDVTNFRRIREHVIIEIVKQFRQEGIDFAFPSQSIYLTNEN